MSHLEKMEALLDDMGVWYVREDADEAIYLSVPGRVIGYKNGGNTEAFASVVFDKHGNCLSFNPWSGE